MRNAILTIALMLGYFTYTNHAEARKPAVEDFVGVESSEYKKTPPGTEVLFNFGNEIQKINTNTESSTPQQPAWFGLFALGLFVSFPIFMWIGITNSTRSNKSHEEKSHDIITPEAAVTDLNTYRAKKDEESKDDSKKAS